MPTTEVASIYADLGLALPAAGDLVSEDPSSGDALATLQRVPQAAADAAVCSAHDAFIRLRKVPGPKRGELVRALGDRLTEHKESLSRLVCAEVGKGIEEARGEVQEMIDICHFAQGLSRTLGGLTLMSERPGHRMIEQWHPLGPVLCISAFNFPVAVWAWNAALALVCGDPMIWKPSLLAPLCADATHRLLEPVLAAADLGGVFNLVIGDDDAVAKPLVADPRIPLVSATGSCAMGRAVGPVVAARLGRSLLELGGNNAIIVDGSADLGLATKAIAFGAAGTAGQRCTTTRRVFLAKGVAAEMRERLVASYRQMLGRVGDPRDAQNLIGPLINKRAQEGFVAAIARARADGGEVLVGGNALDRPGYFVEPTLIQVPDGAEFPLMAEETFAPIAYIREYDGDLSEAIAMQNSVEQGLSSALFSDSIGAMESFLGAGGSDCGIANINLGTSGAEIGGAFGGDKATGGGREAGSDSWKAYMRRQTTTINGSGDLPLAQGIRWDE